MSPLLVEEKIGKTKSECICRQKQLTLFFETLLTHLEQQDTKISKLCAQEKWDHNLPAKKIVEKNENCEKHQLQKTNSNVSHSFTHLEQKMVDEMQSGNSKGAKDNENVVKIVVEICSCDGKTSNHGKQTKENNNQAQGGQPRVCKDQPRGEKTKTKNVEVQSFFSFTEMPTCETAKIKENEERVKDLLKRAEEFRGEYMKLKADKDKQYLAWKNEKRKRETLKRILCAELQEKRSQMRNSVPKNNHNSECQGLAVEIERAGEKETIVLHPCTCPEEYTQQNRPADGKGQKSCIEAFEEQYGNLLIELQSAYCDLKRQLEKLKGKILSQQIQDADREHNYCSGKNPQSYKAFIQTDTLSTAEKPRSFSWADSSSKLSPELEKLVYDSCENNYIGSESSLIDISGKKKNKNYCPVTNRTIVLGRNQEDEKIFRFYF